MKKSKPIFIDNLSLAPWKKINEDVFLDSKGRIYSKSLPPIKDTTRSKDFKRMYGFCEEYFGKKRLKYDMQNFYKLDIRGVVEMMQNESQKSISVNKLIEIYNWRNQIANIKRQCIGRFKKFIHKRCYLAKDK